jgi:CubicO group peptidase (beta-lactamase class C family)
LVTLYSSAPDKKLFKSTGKESPIYIDNVNYPIEGAKTYNSGGGGLTSTAPDYSRFAQMLLNKGELEGMRILSRKSVELISKAQIDWNGDGKLDYGFGFQIEGDRSKVPELGTEGVFSGAGAFYGYFWIDPVENFTGVFMSQVLPSQTDVASKVRTMVYQALK